MNVKTKFKIPTQPKKMFEQKYCWIVGDKMCSKKNVQNRTLLPAVTVSASKLFVRALWRTPSSFSYLPFRLWQTANNNAHFKFSRKFEHNFALASY